MNRFFLRLALFFAPLYRGAGADVPQLRAILGVKLLMDNRKPMSLGRPQKKPSRFTLFLTMLFAFFAGIIYIMPLIGMADRMSGLFFYYTFFLLFISFSLITDFSAVLIDTRDKHILLPRPVSDRTLALARMLHVSIYLFRTVLPMGLPGWIACGFLFGWKAAVLFPLPLLLLTALALFLVNGLYLFLLRLVTPEKFKEVINYFQIAFSVLVFASYYLLPRMSDAARFQSFNLTTIPWVQWTPPYWLASVWAWIGVASPFAGAAIFGGVALVAPVLALWIALRFLAPAFSRKLGGIDAVSDAPQVRTRRVKASRLYGFFSRLFTRTSGGRAGFSLAWLQTARSRSFKMRVYPSLAYVPVYFVYLLSSSRGDIGGLWERLPQSNSYLLLLYLSSFVLLQALSYITVSDQYKAAWVYTAAPLRTPGRLMGGAFTAVWVKFFLPYFIAIGVFVLSVWGLGKLLDLVLALCNVTLFAMVVMRVGYRRLPFSLPESAANSSGRALRVILAMLVPGILGFAHYAATPLWWLKAVLALLSAAFLWMIWNSFIETGWKEVYKIQTE